MKKVVEVQLAELVDMSVPAAVFEEVKNNFIDFIFYLFIIYIYLIF